jgi:hypothetical protein
MRTAIRAEPRLADVRVTRSIARTRSPQGPPRHATMPRAKLRSLAVRIFFTRNAPPPRTKPGIAFPVSVFGSTGLPEIPFGSAASAQQTRGTESVLGTGCVGPAACRDGGRERNEAKGQNEGDEGDCCDWLSFRSVGRASFPRERSETALGMVLLLSRFLSAVLPRPAGSRSAPKDPNHLIQIHFSQSS